MTMETKLVGSTESGLKIRIYTVLAAVCLLVLATAGLARAVTPWYASMGTHIIVMKPDGTVWTVGNNQYGQLGMGSSIEESNEPGQVPGIYNVVAVAAGRMHSVALRQDGTVWAWGNNKYGQLGDGTITDSSTPVQVFGLKDVIAITAGYRHVAALKKDGTVWAWGSNHSGQLGQEGSRSFLTPIQVTELKGVTAISAGSFQTAALKSDGSVWTWGFNGSGQLGSANRESSYNVPGKVAELGNIIAITAGNNHMAALKNDGTIWAWGSNIASQLGNDSVYEGSLHPMKVSGLTGVKDITAKVNHTFALMQDGTVMAWGDSSSGQWGNGIAMNGSAVPVQMRGVSGLIAVAAIGNPMTLVKNAEVAVSDDLSRAENLLTKATW